MNKRLVEVSAPQSKPSFQTFEKSLLYVRGLSLGIKWHHDLRKFKNKWQIISTHMFRSRDKLTNKELINHVLNVVNVRDLK